jgi:thiol-disulfide isomerase/thioredoxin
MKVSSRLVKFTCSALFLAVTLSGLDVHAQQTARTEAVSASATFDPVSVSKGDHSRFKIVLSISPGYHINADRPDDKSLIPTVFTPSPVTGSTWGEPAYPEATYVIEGWSPEPLKVFNGEVVIRVVLNVSRSVPPGRLTAGGKLQLQACDREICLPPESIELSAQLTVSGTKDSAAAAGGNAQPTPATAPVSTATSSKRVNLSEGAVVEDFAFTDFTGKTHRLSDFRGRVVLLDFWATWCKPCLTDIPHLKGLYEKYKDKGFEIIGMDSETLGQDEGDNDPEFAKERDERARQIVSTRGASWTHATAATAVPVAEKIFGVKTLPTKILIDAQGKIVARVEEGAELDAWLEKLLGGKQ